MGASSHNYTDLDVSQLPKKISFRELWDKHRNDKSSLFLVSSIIVFVVSLVFTFTTIANTQRTTNTKAAVPTQEVQITDLKYSTLDEIPFTPSIVNDYVFDKQSLMEQAREAYPDLSETDMQALVKNRIVYWAALTDKAKAETEEISSKQITVTKTIAEIEQEVFALSEEHDTNAIGASGFYLKVRYGGVYDENKEKLDDTSDLKTLAKTELDTFLQDYPTANLAPFTQATMLEEFNINETIQTLNNDEDSLAFDEEILYPPLFDDPDFYRYIEETPINSFTEPIILKTKTPGMTELEEYAYVVFYLNSKQGDVVPVEVYVDNYVSDSTLR